MLFFVSRRLQLFRCFMDFELLKGNDENMKTAQELKREYTQTLSGSFARNYFKYLGFRRDLTAPPATANANAIEALFTLPEPYI